MKPHPARILMLIGFALFIILLFMLISCNTIPDKYQVRLAIQDTVSFKPLVRNTDTVYIFIHDTTYIIQEVSK